MLKSNTYLFIIVIALMVLINSFAYAQDKISISGKVFDKESKEPLYYCVVNLEGTSYYDLTDEKGIYEISDIVPGKYNVFVKILGYQEFTQELVLTKSLKNFDFYINKASLSLEDVVVTAKATQSEEGSTTYKIGNDAIQQVQPISVSDILQLVPGNKVSQTNLNRTSGINLRNTGGYESVNSFGTAVIVDGNQLSNDANMQGGTNSVANRGVDLREISASDIESVEVVSGVASAKYGNITSGAVIIKKKAGKTPLNFNFNTTPTAYQIGGSKGVKLPDASFLNISADYTYSNSTVTSRKNYYQRINTGLRWTKELSKKLKWNNNLSFTFGHFFDGERTDPDEFILISQNENKNQSYAFTTSGSLKLLGNLNYSLSANYRKQHSIRKVIDDGPIPIMESLEEGTNIVAYSPVSFYQNTEFFGEPLNINANIGSDQSFKFLGMKHNTSVGIQYSFNKNYGKGRVIEDGAAAIGAGARSMNFYNVPTTEIYSSYLQDNINIEGDKTHHMLKLGVRYDNMMGKYNLLSPRLSASGKYFDFLRLRVAYGLSYKAPSMLQIYPGPVYFDIINLNHYSNEDIRSFAVVTTKIHQPVNEELRPSKGKTFEFGFDIEHEGFSARVTAFNKTIDDGITSTSKLKTFERVLYDVVEEIPGQMPEVYATDSSMYVSSTFTETTNNLISTTKGIEVSLNFPKIKATNTKISLSGNAQKTTTKKFDPKLRSSASLTGAQKSRYGVYENPSYDTYNATSNMTVVQHIPAIKLLVTLIAETNWYYKTGVSYIPSPYPIAYYDSRGNYIEIAEEERSSDAYSDLYYSPNFYKNTPTPTYMNFHLQVRKETKQGHNFSFYANNFLWYNPTHEDPVNKQRVYKNGPITFGFGMNFKF